MIRSLILLGLLAVAAMPARGQGRKEEACIGEYGTSMRFEKSPSEAARKALKEEKLVIVIHVSGNFEDPAFT